MECSLRQWTCIGGSYQQLTAPFNGGAVRNRCYGMHSYKSEANDSGDCMENDGFASDAVGYGMKLQDKVLRINFVSCKRL